MKIEGPGRAQATDKSRGKGKVSGDGRFGSMMDEGGPQETSGATATQSIASIDSLLALQEADDPAQRAARKRMRARGDDLLKELDKIRLGLLSGTLTIGHVIDIADVVASHREKVTDPELTAILDEIDLRAQIELAKMRFSLDKKAAR